MELIDYRPEHREVCAAVWLTSQITACPEISQDIWVERYKKIYHELLPSLHTMIAWQDNAPEGFLSLNEEAQIVLFNTAVCFQRKGHGTALLQAAKNRFPEGLFATLPRCDTSGRTFLEHAGFACEEDQAPSGEEVRMVWKP
jgi:N-acetylglutamate synthase-like GNAT family acetyltransferase